MTAVAPRSVDLALETEAINALRVLSIDAVQAANSGHPGLPLGAAPISCGAARQTGPGGS